MGTDCCDIPVTELSTCSVALQCRCPCMSLPPSRFPLPSDLTQKEPLGGVTLADAEASLLPCMRQGDEGGLGREGVWRGKDGDGAAKVGVET